MIFSFASIGAWFIGSKAGRVMMMIVAGITAVLVARGWWKSEGRAEQAAVQKEADDAAVVRSEAADTEFRDDGGAAKRLRDGIF